MKKIKLVKQEDCTGCGIACLAMVTNRTYEETKINIFETLKWSDRKRVFYTKAKDLYNYLMRNNYDVELKKSKNWDEIQGLSIVGVNRESGYFHWIVVVKNDEFFYIVDPDKKKAGVYNGGYWSDKYIHSMGRSDYISINNINISRIFFQFG